MSLRKFIKFIIAGAINTGFTYLIFIGFLQLFSYQFAFTISFGIGVFASYVMNTFFVFNASFSLKPFLYFPLIYVGQYIGGIFGMIFFIDYLSVPGWLAPFLVLMFTVPLTFLCGKLIYSERNMGAKYVAK